ncbi:MAG TPA: Gfo/Idh/MocA family oxidoreductase [Acidimicrobiales bacterium]|nr:Gfo/Idh/MocA family oxidoreductase [Acidimicrobiales bacterium]
MGLGDIARKGYLPALAVRGDIEVHLCTRDPLVLAEVGDAYRFDHRHDNLDDLLAADVEAAFVHVATAAHVEVVSRLLAAGVHVYVDKPLADNLADCAHLVELARSKGRSLMVGFNRRHAPSYREAAALQPSLVVMQKNRVGAADSPRRVVFDDFIHVVDTLRFLAPQADLQSVHAAMSDGVLDLVAVQLVGPGVVAIGAMNRSGGHTQEILDIHAHGVRRVVHDIAAVDEYRDDRHTLVRRGDWTSVQQQRGFDDICERFISAVADNELLDADDALRTHEMCERVVKELET